MSKLILLLLVAAVIYLLLRVSRGRAAPPGAARRGAASSRQPAAEPFVVCAHCGLNVPRSEALVANDRHYCCEEHRQLG